MRIDKGKLRAPEIGRVWLNSAPLNMRMLRGRIVLVDFWDYTCVNCLRTLPYMQAWHERYRDKGLTVIGVHTPEFTFAQYESNVERGVREFGLTYSIVIDSNFELWQAFANRYWPAKYLIDKDGYVRYAHFGEGAYEETERAIQELLREIDANISLPSVLEAVRAEDRPGAVCERPTPELYLGHRRGRIANAGGFHEDETFDYEFSSEIEEKPGGGFYARGRWSSTAEFLESAGDATVALGYSAAAVNLVMAPAQQGAAVQVEIRQDGQPLSAAIATRDTQFRDGVSYISVDRPRMYVLVDNHAFGGHTLELRCPPGARLYAFTFTSCVASSEAAA